MGRIVLVHGAWCRAESWGAFPARLAARGHEVAALTLPGHAPGAAADARRGLDDYAIAIAEELAKGPPALLVGHSMGGMAISAAAELAPGHVRKLGYICAFLPRDGDSLVSLMAGQGDRTVGAAVRRGPGFGITTLDPDIALPFLCPDATAEDQAALLATLVPQPSLAQTDPVTLTAGRFGRIPRAYVICERDATILPGLQRGMIAASPCAEVFALPSGHFPQISCPGDLAGILTTL